MLTVVEIFDCIINRGRCPVIQYRRKSESVYPMLTTIKVGICNDMVSSLLKHGFVFGLFLKNILYLNCKICLVKI